MKAELAVLIERLRGLESTALAIYTRLAGRFADEPDLHKFWMSMARHEAGHVGALALLSELIDQGGQDVQILTALRIAEDASQTIDALAQEVKQDVGRDRAFGIALELESLEVEDVVLDLIHVLSDEAARHQAAQMLLHDLSDLSLMIEKHTKDEELLARADALVEERVGHSRREPSVVRRVS